MLGLSGERILLHVGADERQVTNTRVVCIYPNVVEYERALVYVLTMQPLRRHAALRVKAYVALKASICNRSELST